MTTFEIFNAGFDFGRYMCLLTNWEIFGFGFIAGLICAPIIYKILMQRIFGHLNDDLH